MGLLVIPAQAGIQIATLDSRLRGNDGMAESDFDDAPIIQWSVLSADSGILHATLFKGN
jgi:hypothetical protein